MKKRRLIIFSSLIFALGCNNLINEQEIKEVDALRASKIYYSDSVEVYIEKYGDKNKEIADAYHEKAENEENAEKACYYYKRAITLNPTLDRYKALAGQLEKMKDYEELTELYKLLIQRNYTKRIDGKDSTVFLFATPDEDMVYEYLLSDIMAYQTIYAEDIYWASHDLDIDLARIKERLQNDKRFTLDPGSKQYQYIMLQFLPYDQIRTYAETPKTFNEFIASIIDTSLFNLDAKEVQKFDYGNSDGEGYSNEFEGVYVYYLKEKREYPGGWFDFNFERAFPVNDSIVAVVYAIDSSETACPIDMRHLYHRLVTYDSVGNILDNKIVAFQAGEALQTAVINRNNIETTRYKRIWRKPYKKFDFDNFLECSEMIDIKRYHINPDGHIEENPI